MKKCWKQFYTQILFALVVCISSAASFSPVFAASTFWKAESQSVPAELFNNADNDVGIVKNGSDLWVQMAGFPDGASDPVWLRYKGTTVDTLTRQADGILDSSFNRPNGDDRYWSSGIWQDSNGTWYTPVHVEYAYYAFNSQGQTTYPHWKRRIGLATSNDQGAHWHYQADILTYNPNQPGKPDPSDYNFGDGDLRLFVDSATGYFYIYYATGWTNPTSTDIQGGYVAVARSPISAHMAPGSWTKWYLGSWSQPGLQGSDSEVFPGATSSLTIQYSTYLNKYVMIDDGRITTATDLGLQDWVAPDTTFLSTLWYNWTVDQNTQNKYQIGQAFRLYTSQNDNDNEESRYTLIRYPQGNGLSYDATGGYDTVQGQDQWRYQYMTGSSYVYSDMAWDSTNNIWAGPEPYCWIGIDYQHPGNANCAASRTWIAPASGAVTIAASNHTIRSVDTGGTGVDVMITLNGTQLWPAAGWQHIPSGSSLAVPTLTATVSLGDALHFLVRHSGSTNDYDSTAWDPLIVYSTYDAATGFSATQGQDQWRYQYTTDEATYNNMIWDNAQNRWEGPENYCLVDFQREHPGNVNCVPSRTWIAPTDGHITFGGNQITVDTGAGAAGVDVMIMLNGTQLWPTTGWQHIAAGGSLTVPTLTAIVSAGDALHFLVRHSGSTNSFDSTYWDPLVTFAQN